MSAFENTDIDLGGDGLARDAEVLRQASLDITRLGSLARSGEAKGGVLDAKQWADAANLSKRVGDNLGSWLKHTKDLRGELRNIVGDLDGLSKASHDPSLSAKTRGTILTEMASLEARKGEINAELKNRAKGDARAGGLRKQAEEYGATIEGYQDENKGGVNWWSMAKRGAMIGAAIAGVRSISALAMDAKEKAKVFDLAGTDLFLRSGINISDEKAAQVAQKIGVRPTEFVAAAETLNKATSSPDSDAVAATLQGMGRRYGVGDAYVGHTASTVAATGGDPSKAPSALIALTKVATAIGAGGRLEEILGLNAKLLTDIAGRRGGKDLSPHERTQLDMMQMALWSHPGQIGKGASGVNMIETMDQGIRSGGGSPGIQALIANALGVKDVRTSKDLWEYEKRKFMGATVGNVLSVINASKEFAKVQGMSEEDTRYATLFNLKGITNNPMQAEVWADPKVQQYLKLNDKYGAKTVEEALAGSPEGQKLWEEAQERAKNMAALHGTKTRLAEATLEASELPSGRSIQGAANIGRTAVAGAIDIATGVVTEVKDAIQGNHNTDRLIDAIAGTQKPAPPVLAPRFRGALGEH
jgi:hypothetical protein